MDVYPLNCQGLQKSDIDEVPDKGWTWGFMFYKMLQRLSV